MSKPKDYELRIKAVGARVRLKQINSTQFKYWSKKSESDLLNYLQAGPEDFSEFAVPKSALISFLADEEKDLELFFFGGGSREQQWALPEMPLDIFAIDGVESVKLYEVNGGKRKVIEKSQDLSFPQLTSDDETGESIDVSVRTSRYNLIVIEQVQNEWVYKWNGIDAVPALAEMQYIPVNGDDADLEEFIGDGGLVWDVVLHGRICDERDVNYEDAGESFAVVVERD